MKKFISALAVVVALSGTAHAQDFQKGLAAAQAGDYATALQEWRPLAEQGHAFTQYNLGLMYYNGEGVLLDFVYAHMWANIAAFNGNDDGIETRDRLTKEMTSADISKAQNLARECLAKNYKGC